MAVGLKTPGKLIPVAGLRLAALHSGIKRDTNLKDLVLVELCANATIAAVFTKNKFCAAPVLLAKKHLAQQKHALTRYLLINSGSANAGTGERGYQAALICCQKLAEQQQAPIHSVLPFSTGVIATPLPSDKICKAIPRLCDKLDRGNWLEAAEGMMTTDTLPKAVSKQVNIKAKRSPSPAWLKAPA